MKSLFNYKCHRFISGVATKVKNEPPFKKNWQRNKRWVAWGCFGLGGCTGYLLATSHSKLIQFRSSSSLLFWNYNWDTQWNHQRNKLKDPSLLPSNEQLLTSNDKTINTSILNQAFTFLQLYVLKLISSGSPKSFVKPPKARRQIILIRHGQYKDVGGGDDTTQGLTELGREQAHLVGNRLAEVLENKAVTGIFYSDMTRAKETAQIIAGHLPKTVPLIEDPTLAEGIPAFPEPPRPTFRPSNLEVQIGASRIGMAFERYFYRPTAIGDAINEDIQETFDIIVCHGNVIRYFFCRALQFPCSAWLRLAVYNCGTTWLSIDDHGYVSARELGGVGYIPAEKVTYS